MTGARHDLSQGKLIAIDWGTSRLRAWLVDVDGRVLADAENDKGIGAIDRGHEAIFESAVAGWPTVPAIMAGMIGSRQGWREAAYVPCPTTPAALATKITRLDTASGRPVAIVPGLVLAAPTRDGDVIRGEETQMIGLIDREPAFSGTAILPGTHSKWARIEKGVIVDFQSFITGELFELLSRKSFLRHSVAADDGDLSAAPGFALGVKRTAKDGLPFLSALFSVRTRQLLGNVRPEDNLAYLSGIVIGGEIAAARTIRRLDPTTPVRIVGARSLARAYHAALQSLGFETVALDGDRLVLDGLVHLARGIGLLPARLA
jgi:2-dehydro-3-deoxygalactonokinase